MKMEVSLATKTRKKRVKRLDHPIAPRVQGLHRPAAPNPAAGPA